MHLLTTAPHLDWTTDAELTIQSIGNVWLLHRGLLVSVGAWLFADQPEFTHQPTNLEASNQDALVIEHRGDRPASRRAPALAKYPVHCRKHHGALFFAAAVFPQDVVTVEGETRDYAGRFSCPRCGSSVFARIADEIEVNLGSLDAPDQLMPTYESWIVRRESWLPPFPLTRRYERDRDARGRFEE